MIITLISICVLLAGAIALSYWLVGCLFDAMESYDKLYDREITPILKKQARIMRAYLELRINALN